MNKKIIYLLFIIIPFLSFCERKEISKIPNTYVNIRIDLDLPQYLPLQNVTGSVLIENEGYNKNGIIIFCSNVYEYKAYDCTCTYQIDKSCKVKYDPNSVVNVVCECCKSRFELFSGNKTKGEAIYPLKEYRVTVSGSVLTVTN